MKNIEHSIESIIQPSVKSMARNRFTPTIVEVEDVSEDELVELTFTLVSCQIVNSSPVAKLNFSCLKGRSKGIDQNITICVDANKATRFRPGKKYKLILKE